MQRRSFLASSAAFVAATASGALAEADGSSELARIEARSGGRLGVFARDTGSGRTIAHRSDERFPMCSTFKMLAVAAILARVDHGLERRDRRLTYTKADLLDPAPVTSAHLATGSMTIADLCAAALISSDNTAANLLLHALGGPHALTAFLRSRPVHDPITRLDRFEPTLNSAIPGDPRDTTTPHQIAHVLSALLLSGDVLRPESSRQLEGWMRKCTTGLTALRAGVPAGWITADKTGAGANGTRNDVALLRRPGRAPIVIAAYLTGATVIDADQRNAALAAVARAVCADIR